VHNLLSILLQTTGHGMTRQVEDGFRWSTGHVGRADRFAYWRESLSANLIGMTPEAAPEDRKDFEGQITRIPVGDTGLMQLDMKITKLRTNRAASDIRALPGDGVFLFRATAHDMNFLFHDRESFVPQPGTTVMGGLDRERYSEVSQRGRYRCDVLRIPSAAFRGVIDDPSRLDPREVDHSTGPSALLHGFFNSFVQELPRLTPPERETGLTTLTGLATLSLRRDRAKQEPVRDAVRAARLRALQDYIMRYASDPGLSPALVARALRMSSRQVHALFEPSGTTFSRFLMAERIRRALQMLADQRVIVSDVAFRCGFESLPTFYRAFKIITGTSPRESRSQITLPN
jgi:AraC-like DNA-binding protein